ncbi:GrpB family protein [Paenibacillus agilis]|uniref:GrpB family protein n=1 Tax=Paenibacillus agilis TaxID=3020863 RepID=A0A559IYC9_9BACL|nr:GrpB family protein [Paenibacillus agilis]TVX92644.1 GrpB family protein [Paenibacillus agilis]
MLGLPKGQVYLVPWTEQWEIEFNEEVSKIRCEINGGIVAIHHIGSTAVKGLSAKPIIDIAIELKSFDAGIHCVPGLERLGYVYRGTDVLPDRHYFNKGEPRTHQIHMFQTGSEYLDKQLTLRDYLRENEDARNEYQELKQKLTMEHSTNKLAYADSKTVFINKIIWEANQGK